MSALSTHHKWTKRETKTVKNKETRKNMNKWQKLERSKNKSLDQAEIDSLRQGQRLDAIDQTQAWLLKDRGRARHSHARNGRKTRKTRSQTRPKLPWNSPWNAFPLTSATLTTCMHSQSPVHNKFLVLSKIKQFSPCSITKILALVGTCTHQA